MANDIDGLDQAEAGPEPAEGRELVIVDLGHKASCSGHGRRAGAALVGEGMPAIYA